MSETSDIMRKMMQESDDKRDAGLNTPEDISRWDDILYGPDGEWHLFDVYRPKQAEGKQLPVIVNIHGGGWVYGRKEQYQYYCMNLAQRGFAVVNFTFRLAPEFQFPSPLEDTNLVFEWILGHAQEYGLDTDHMFAVGDSAGAHTLAMYAAICTNPEYAAKYAFQPKEELRLQAVALNCGEYQVEMSDDEEDLFTALMKEFLPEGGSQAELELLNLEKHITPDYPPVFIMTTVDDILKEEDMYLVAALKINEVPFIHRLYGSARNRLGHVFHCDIRSRDARQCNDEECTFFRGFL